ncbi:M23 family metallopeptidase [Rhodococcus marinonascens]|uniref:M23 family metallopeptidase n=1 Tax=Rhodococcus marinonascens TaxID=38311 RepID=UPI0009326BE4|nr:M23 family metallopeptidase [Rhodococcus marinonascens]
MRGTPGRFSAPRRLTATVVGASAAAAVLLIGPQPASGAPPTASGAHTQPSTSLATTVADMLTLTTDAAEPTVVVVDPSVWQTVANITIATVESAEANGSLGDAFAVLQKLAGCLLKWAVFADTAATSALNACGNEVTGIDASIGPRLIAALAYGVADATVPDEAGTPDETDTGTGTQTQTPSTWNGTGTREFVAPSAGSITSRFGGARNHGGIDIANTLGAPIVAVADGEVINAGPAQGYGMWVRIRHDDGTVTTYGHNNDNLVKVGQRVKTGQKIATIGNRGNSTGPHLHFEVETPAGYKTDPLKWLSDRGASIVGID